MRFTGTINRLDTRFTIRRVAARSPVPGRLAKAAVAALALAAAAVATAAPAGAAVLSAGSHQPLAGAGIGEPAIAAPAVWNGTDLVTAQIDPNGNLFAYEQVPGATKWAKQEVAPASPIDGAPLGVPWITATSSSVQIVSQDSDGNIWFFQQADGQTGWSGGQLVGTVTVSPSLRRPRIAWTGVPGHAGTNSVITVGDAAGDVLFWWQNGSTWSQQTVVTGTSQISYYAPAITATDRGVVIVATGSNGAFYSWYQPYGGSGWTSDGSVGVAAGDYGEASVTWDGVNVDVAAPRANGQLVFLWKSDSAQFWSDEVINGPDSSHPLAYQPAIAYTGSNLVIAAVQTIAPTRERLDFWWQGSTFTNFNFEPVTTATVPNQYFTPALLEDAGPSGEGAIFAPFTTNNALTLGLNDWTELVGGTGWTKHIVVPA